MPIDPQTGLTRQVIRGRDGRYYALVYTESNGTQHGDLLPLASGLTMVANMRTTSHVQPTSVTITRHTFPMQQAEPYPGCLSPLR